LNAQIVNLDDFVRMQPLDVRVVHQALVVIKLQPNARSVRQDGSAWMLHLLVKFALLGNSVMRSLVHVKFALLEVSVKWNRRIALFVLPELKAARKLECAHNAHLER